PISVAKSHFVVHPNVDAYSSFDFEHAAEMIEIGYDATRRVVADLRDKWEKAPAPADKIPGA
ncbi:MAG TPA: hypothetical protein VFU38_07805, partial [Candidatus Krumholzibacteria bacterium]|nr:hypothetical protein [Candidatus Krumholzibacteria bacterium]